ncbi:hypothetical protein [Bacillus sp. FSL R5-0443]
MKKKITMSVLVLAAIVTVVLGSVQHQEAKSHTVNQLADPGRGG